MNVSSARALKVLCIPLYDILCAIPIFKSDFKNLTLEHKSMFFIIDNGIDLTRISLKVYKYN